MSLQLAPLLGLSPLHKPQYKGTVHSKRSIVVVRCTFQIALPGYQKIDHMLLQHRFAMHRLCRVETRHGLPFRVQTAALG